MIVDHLAFPAVAGFACPRSGVKAPGPAFEAYARGDHEAAWAIFLSVGSGLDWATCRALLEQRLPGAVAQAIKDADTMFGIELPALTKWAFGPDQAAAIHCPVLSIHGRDTGPLWVEGAAFLRSSLPHVQDCTINRVGHLLHIQHPEPIARAVAEYLGSNPMPGNRHPGPTTRATTSRLRLLRLGGDDSETRLARTVRDRQAANSRHISRHAASLWTTGPTVVPGPIGGYGTSAGAAGFEPATAWV